MNDRDHSRAELERALREVPAYDGWRAFDPGQQAEVDERYAALPVTTKAQLREHAPRAYVPRGMMLDAALARHEVELVQTSGTTGPPTTLVWNQRWWNASERASWALNSVAQKVATGEHREAVLASPRCVGPGMHERPLSMQERTLGRLLFLNEHPDVAAWSDADVRRMHDEWHRYAPTVVEADPYYLAAFCARAEALRLKPPEPALLVFTYARPTSLHLRRIRRMFDAPHASSYGSTETGYVLFSCEHERLHHNAASCRLDVCLVRPGLARLWVTPFGNEWMCLLRFDVGDLARPAREACPCGRNGGWVFEDLEGRTDDVTTRGDGTLVTAAELDRAVSGAGGTDAIVSYQLTQRGASTYDLRVTATAPFDSAALARALHGLYGRDATVHVLRVSALEPLSSGKYRVALAL